MHARLRPHACASTFKGRFCVTMYMLQFISNVFSVQNYTKIAKSASEMQKNVSFGVKKVIFCYFARRFGMKF